MKFKFLFVFLALYNFSISQVPDLSNWKLHSRFKKEDNKIRFSNDRWRFLKSGDKWEIVAHKYDYQKGDSLLIKSEYLEKNLNINPWYRSVKKIPGGYLIGVWLYDSYGLYFISDDGIHGYKMSGSFLIQQVFEYNNKYYAIEGDIQGPFGNILEIYKKGNVWTYKKVAETTPPAMIVAKYKNEIVGLTPRSIFKFGKDLKPKELLKSPFFFGMLNPFTMLFNNDDLYIAMHGGVLKIIAFDTNPSYEWWVPK